MLSSTAYGRNIIPPHICYSIIVEMIDFLVNCISAPYIIKICDFVALWNEDNIRRELSSFVQNLVKNVCWGFPYRPFLGGFFCVPCFVLKFCHISKVKIWIATDRSVSSHLAKFLIIILTVYYCTVLTRTTGISHKISTEACLFNPIMNTD